LPPLTLSPRLLDAVRASTRPTHDALERRLDLASGGWTRATYAAFLRATLAVAAPIEAAVDAHLQPLFDSTLGLRPRAERLRHDLHSIGASIDVGEAPALPPVAGVAAALGAAYVLHGSLLGGRGIAASLEEEIGLSRDSLTYLAPPHLALGASWRAFTAALDAFGHSASPIERDAVVVTAQRTFASFDAAFTREGFA
jgi:heme oxygenase